MTKSSPWPKLLTPLGILLAVALLGAAGSVWWNGGGTTMVNDGGLGELIALTQAARSDANAAVQGDERRSPAEPAVADGRAVGRRDGAGAHHAAPPVLYCEWRSQ